MTSPDPRAALADELLARADKYLNTGSGEYASEIMRDMAKFIACARSPFPYSRAAGEAVAWQRRLDGGSWHECTAEQAKYASEFGHPENFPTLAAEIRALSPSPTSLADKIERFYTLGFCVKVDHAPGCVDIADVMSQADRDLVVAALRSPSPYSGGRERR